MASTLVCRALDGAPAPQVIADAIRVFIGVNSSEPSVYVFVRQDATLSDVRIALRKQVDKDVVPDEFYFTIPTNASGNTYVRVGRTQETYETVTEGFPPVVINTERRPSSPQASTAVTVDDMLRSRYRQLLAAGKEKPLSDRAIAYNALDCDDTLVIPGVGFVKRLDGRRSTKRASAAKANETVVLPTVDPTKFNFTKIFVDEVLMSLWLAGKQFRVITNKFPACHNHLLLTTADLQAQALTHQLLAAASEFVAQSHFNLGFNSWSAASSVNHVHFHMLDETPPIAIYELVACASHVSVGDRPIYHMRGYPGANAAFDADDVAGLWSYVEDLQRNNQPHNLLYTRTHAYVFPRNPDPEARGQHLFGAEIGLFELAGVFTVFDEQKFHEINSALVDKMLSSTTMEPVSGACGGKCVCDDATGVVAMANTSNSPSFLPRDLTSSPVPSDHSSEMSL
eukprot:GFYU01002206.1.p1 GENE.GFYU01002206.1~~GFYU01002206.1.p1  ORF type:complete len:454 (-),score=129.01 GFYU01002206.1:372-1733(-)